MSFSLQPTRFSSKTKWGPHDEKIIIPNVPSILPSNLSPDLLHALILRAQFEETQYKLDHIVQETQFNMDKLSTSLESRGSVFQRTKDNLLADRRQIIDSIQQFYPPFAIPELAKSSMFRSMKKIIIPNSKCVDALIGPKFSNINNIEKNYKVKLYLQLDDSAKGSELSVTIHGNSQDSVDNCAKTINQIIQSVITTLSTLDNSEIQQQISQLLSQQSTDHLPLSNILSNKHEGTIDNEPIEKSVPWSDLNNDNSEYTLQNSDVENSQLNEEINGIEGRVEDENILTLEELKRYSTDVIAKDISAVLIPEQLSGLI